METNLTPALNRGRYQHKFGYNPSLDATSTPKDITPFGDASFPDTAVDAADIDIVSSSGDDKGTPTAGTGARTILLKGLDADYLEIQETVTLNGTTDVHPTKDYLRIYRVEVLTAGSGGVNAGNIIIDIGGANTMAYVLDGFNKTTQAAYTIPANYNGKLLGFDCQMNAVAASKFAQGQLLIREFGALWHVEHVFGVSSEKDYEHPYRMNFDISAKSDVRLRIFGASAASLLVSGSLGIYLEPKLL